MDISIIKNETLIRNLVLSTYQDHSAEYILNHIIKKFKINKKKHKKDVISLMTHIMVLSYMEQDYMPIELTYLLDTKDMTQEKAKEIIANYDFDSWLKLQAYSVQKDMQS